MRMSERQKNARAEIDGRLANHLTYRRGKARPFRDTSPNRLQMIVQGTD